MSHPPLALSEVFGLTPLRDRFADLALALRGDASTPPSRFDHTSLKILSPRLSVPLWLGRRPRGRRIPIYNLFNHTPTPVAEGWSVRKTQVRDFRGGDLTYDSHNGTDFAIPPGTVVVAAAPGRVGRVSNEFHRGGLKILIDHGDGLATGSNHLGRALVAPGDEVRRGQPIALSGYSGLDGVVAFPWSPPHVHFNVFLNGANVDPFASAGGGEVPLWRRGTEPTPCVPGDEAETAPAATFSPEGVAALLAACRHPGSRADIERGAELLTRGTNALFHRAVYPTRFDADASVLYAARAPRRPALDLPFRREDFDGVTFDWGPVQ